jgi:aldose 1-epimerase
LQKLSKGGEMKRQHEPRTPPGWEQNERRLVRFADPDGGAVAWIAPEFGGNCIGYAVRRAEGWQQILHSAGPEALRAAPTRFGLPILFPFPGHVRDSRYRWAGIEYQLPPNVVGRRHYVHGFAQSHPWRVARSGAGGVIAEFSTLADLPDRAAAGYPFAVSLRLTLQLTGGALLVRLTATNEGEEEAPVGLGLHPYFAVDALGGDRTAVRAWLPGRSEHTLAAAIPTGGRVAVEAGATTLPPPGQTLLVAHTDLGERAVAALAGPPGSARITMRLDEGCRDLLLFAPDQQPSVSLEPHSVAPGAASQPPGSPDGLVGLQPQATTSLAVTISA